MTQPAPTQPSPIEPSPTNGAPPSGAADPGDPQDLFALIFKLLRELGPAAYLGVGGTVFPALTGLTLFASVAFAQQWLQSLPGSAVLWYALGFVVLSGLALVPTFSTAYVGGFTFGFAAGLPAALIGFLGGSAIAYEICRRVAGSSVRQVLERRPKWLAIRDALAADIEARTQQNRGAGFWKTLGVVTLIRLPPSSPFALTNLLLAGVGVPRLPYFLGTLFGMVPRTVVMVWMGAHTAELVAQAAGEAKIVRPAWWLPVGLGLAIVVVLILNKIAHATLDRVIKPGSGEGRPG